MEGQPPLSSMESCPCTCNGVSHHAIELKVARQLSWVHEELEAIMQDLARLVLCAHTACDRNVKR